MMNPILIRLPSKPSADHNARDNICNLTKARLKSIFT